MKITRRAAREEFASAVWNVAGYPGLAIAKWPAFDGLPSGWAISCFTPLAGELLGQLESLQNQRFPTRRETLAALEAQLALLGESR